MTKTKDQVFGWLSSLTLLVFLKTQISISELQLLGNLHPETDKYLSGIEQERIIESGNINR